MANNTKLLLYFSIGVIGQCNNSFSLVNKCYFKITLTDFLEEGARN